MKFYAIPVRENGRDQMGTCGVISGEYKSVHNFIRYNHKHFADNAMYSVYIKTDHISSGSSNGWKFQGFHHTLPFSEYARRSTIALAAENR